MDADTISLLRTSVRALLQEDTDVVSGLTDLGWDEVVAEDEAAAVTVLFEEQGPVPIPLPRRRRHERPGT